jgi:hypothetical protein
MFPIPMDFILHLNLWRLSYFWDYLTAEAAEGAEEEKRVLNVSYTDGFYLTSKSLATISFFWII